MSRETLIDPVRTHILIFETKKSHSLRFEIRVSQIAFELSERAMSRAAEVPQQTKLKHDEILLFADESYSF